VNIMNTVKALDTAKIKVIAPSGGVTKGIPFQLGSLVLIPLITKAQNLEVECYTRGTFRMKKNESTAFAAGRWVKWDISAEELVLNGSADAFNIGRTRKAAAADDSHVEVVIGLLPRRMEIIHCPIADIAAVADSLIRKAPFAGLVTRAWTVLQGGAIDGDAIATAKIGATAITGGAITIATASSAAGDLDEVYPTALNVVAKDDSLLFSSNGGGSTTRVVDAYMELEEL
jgi:predicted RecA/RadA family phage recombinase